MPVEHEGFEQDAAGIVDGRTQAEARHAWQRLGAKSMHAHDKNPAKRRPLMRNRDVERGKTEIASELLTMDHMSADDIRASKREARGVQVARNQRGAHA